MAKRGGIEHISIAMLDLDSVVNYLYPESIF